MTRRPLLPIVVLLLLVGAWPVSAQQPVVVAGWGVPGATVTEINPVPMCLSDKTSCFTAFSTAPVFDLNLAGADETPGYAIAIEGPTGPVAVGSGGVSLPVDLGTNNDVQGTVAAGSADSGAPLKIGGVAGVTAIPASVTNGQRVNAFYDKSGRAVVTGSPREFRATGSRIALTASTTETTIITAAASTFHDLVAATCTNESATEVRIDWRDTTGGTVRFSMDLAADGGGSNVFWGPDGYPQGAVNTNWTIQASASVSSVYCSALARKDL